MSITNSLHYQLCTEGAKWLRKLKTCEEDCRLCRKEFSCHLACRRMKWVAVELVTLTAENPDVWGYDGETSILIEVKTSHSDFLADQKKCARRVDECYQLGRCRWYLCPEGVINPSELPPGWGLLYWNGRKVYPVYPPTPREHITGGDMYILHSILLREHFPQKIYDYRKKSLPDH